MQVLITGHVVVELSSCRYKARIHGKEGLPVLHESTWIS